MSRSPFHLSAEHGMRASFGNIKNVGRNLQLCKFERVVLAAFTLVTGAILLSIFHESTRVEVWKLGLKKGAEAGLSTLLPSSFSHSKTVHECDLPLNYTGSFPSAPLNRTLGFGKIFVLNLPKRVDKHDEMTLLGYASDIEFNFVDSVTKEDYEKISMAEYAPDLAPGAIGCYRSHVNALKKVVAENLETALILEDDIDWDVDIKRGMERLQDPSATLIGSMKRDGLPRGPTQSAPYGENNDWDLLYLGACLERAWEGEDVQRRPFRLVGGDKLVDYDAAPYLVYEDETTPEWDKMGESPRKMMDDYKLQVRGGPNATYTKGRRVLQRSHGPICTTSYAVTQRGAARLLYILTRGQIQPVDWLMSWAAEEGTVESYSLFPPIMDQWKIDGSKKNSDINFRRRQGFQARDGRPDVGWSNNIRNSIRRNLESQILPSHL